MSVLLSVLLKLAACSMARQRAARGHLNSFSNTV